MRLSRARKKIGDHLAPRCEHIDPRNPVSLPVAHRRGPAQGLHRAPAQRRGRRSARISGRSTTRSSRTTPSTSSAPCLRWRCPSLLVQPRHRVAPHRHAGTTSAHRSSRRRRLSALAAYAAARQEPPSMTVIGHLATAGDRRRCTTGLIPVAHDLPPHRLLRPRHGDLRLLDRTTRIRSRPRRSTSTGPATSSGLYFVWKLLTPRHAEGKRFFVAMLVGSQLLGGFSHPFDLLVLKINGSGPQVGKWEPQNFWHTPLFAIAYCLLAVAPLARWLALKIPYQASRSVAWCFGYGAAHLHGHPHVQLPDLLVLAVLRAGAGPSRRRGSPRPPAPPPRSAACSIAFATPTTTRTGAGSSTRPSRSSTCCSSFLFARAAARCAASGSVADPGSIRTVTDGRATGPR